MKRFVFMALLSMIGLIVVFSACRKKETISLTSSEIMVTNTSTRTFTLTRTFTQTPTYGSPTDTPTPIPTCPGELLDDMEDNNNQNNWAGYWYTYDDLDSPNNGDSYVVPWSQSRWLASGQPTPEQMFYMQSPGRTGSGYAARMTGYVTTTFQWGFVGMGTTFLEPKTDINVSECTSIRFWHKGDGKTYRVKISSNHPDFLRGEADDHFGRQFVTTTDWKLEDIPLLWLTQERWGTTVNLNDAMSRATDIQFKSVGQPLASIELWVDEIQFCNCSLAQMLLTPTPALTPGKIDDMEDGDAINYWGGYWYTYDDTSGSGRSYIVPRPDETFVMTAPGRPKANGTPTDYAAQVTGNVSTWPPTTTGLAVQLLPGKATFDMSGCGGIRFYYRGDGRDYYVKIVSSHPGFGGSTNYYGSDFSTLDSWQPRQITIAELNQIGTGPTVDKTDALSMATDIIFEPVGPGYFELGIDDLEIYGCSNYPTP